MEPKNKPSIGRIVHFYANGSTTPEAAWVIAVWSDTCVNLDCCNSGGTHHSESSVTEGEPSDTSRSRWCWPPRA